MKLKLVRTRVDSKECNLRHNYRWRITIKAVELKGHSIKANLS